MLYFVVGLLCLILGFVLGWLGRRYILKNRVFGTIKAKVDPDTEELYLYLDLDRIPESMGYYKEVIFKTDLPPRK